MMGQCRFEPPDIELRIGGQAHRHQSAKPPRRVDGRRLNAQRLGELQGGAAKITSGLEHGAVDAMWLFNEKFERALARFNEIAAARR